MKKIKLPCYGIVVSVNGKNSSITSDLHDEPTGEHEEEYDAAIDAIESMILAHASAGVDIESPAYVEGIEAAVEAVANNI